MFADFGNLTGGEELRDLPDFHTEMETRLMMNW
jgi:hypothetical protein